MGFVGIRRLATERDLREIGAPLRSRQPTGRGGRRKERPVGFTTLIVKNALNRPMRTALTAIGLSVAIAAVIILVGISWNFEKSFTAIYRSKKIDLIAVHAGSSNQLSSSLDARLVDRVRTIDGVTDVAPTLVDTVAFEDRNLASVLVNGWVPESLLFRGIRILDGRPLGRGDDHQVLLGRVLALNLDKKVGDRLDISGEPFQVVGIFESESLFENGALIVPLSTLQKMMGREGQATGLVITAKSSEPQYLDSLRRRIESAFPGVAVTPARDYVLADTQIRLAKAMSWATAAIALVLGAVGMLNTMLMSIFERHPRDRPAAHRRLAPPSRAGADPGRVIGDRAGRDGPRRRAGGDRPAGIDALADGPGVHRAGYPPGGPGPGAGHGDRAQRAGRPLPGGPRRGARPHGGPAL